MTMFSNGTTSSCPKSLTRTRICLRSWIGLEPAQWHAKVLISDFKRSLASFSQQHSFTQTNQRRPKSGIPNCRIRSMKLVCRGQKLKRSVRDRIGFKRFRLKSNCRLSIIRIITLSLKTSLRSTYQFKCRMQFLKICAASLAKMTKNSTDSSISSAVRNYMQSSWMMMDCQTSSRR